MLAGNGSNTFVSSSLLEFKTPIKTLSFMKYPDGEVEIEIKAYNEYITKILSVKEVEQLVDWLKNCC